jgi:hypothetical protein
MAESLGAVLERWCIVLIVVEHDGSRVLVVEPTRTCVPCPQCGELSRRQHSRYEWHPLDLPWREQTVHLRIHSRRWFCDIPTCPRKIFAERFDGALARYARRTDGTTELLTSFALQAGGEGGASPGAHGGRANKPRHAAATPARSDRYRRRAQTASAGPRRRGVVASKAATLWHVAPRS